MKFWKVSHGKDSFNDTQFDWLLENNLLAIHRDTGRNQADSFLNDLCEGDIVCLSKSNKVRALVKVESTEVINIDTYDDSPLGEQWLLKPYSVIKLLPKFQVYDGPQKGWTPNYNSTCFTVPRKDLVSFEHLLLKPFFDKTLMAFGYYDPDNNQDEALISMESVPLNLNTILYGPPGTGKTYQTIEASVNAAEPDFKARTRAVLKKKYDELVAEKRIRFVTFHQSYGYEEFVEGLRANSEQGQVSYDVEPGIFKQICEQASQGIEPDSDPLEQALEQFKVDLEEISVLKLKTLRGKEFNVQYHGNNTFRVFPEATTVDDLGKGYAVSIDNIRKLYRDATFKKFYNPSYVKAILNHLKVKYEVKDFTAPEFGQIKNFVLIIDEINRGNISKIFGELITLIEDTKRSGEGQDEALEVVLPNSGDPFTVPNNLYLIGTMNTADRSLAMMDTALRRRFDFVEMMPKPELFNDVTVNEIDLEKLLSKMNQRIEVLCDREHTLGHAFFMPVKALVKDQDKAFNELKSVFKNKIVPLLEEYFFEDWNNIRLVLGDNQKAEGLQFVSEEQQSFEKLFGNDHGLKSYQQEEKRYRLLPFDNDVWNKPEAYIGIYKASKED